MKTFSIFTLITIFFIIILNACTPTPIHIQKAHDVMYSYSSKMRKLGFSPELSGGAMIDDIQKINLGYITNKNLNLEQARLTYIERAEDLLAQVNSNEEIRPYLRNYPFQSKNIFLSIVFEKPNGDYVDPPNIAYIFNTTKGNVIYYIYDMQKEQIECIYEESYDEALRIYRETVGL